MKFGWMADGGAGDAENSNILPHGTLGRPGQVKPPPYRREAKMGGSPPKGG